MSFSSSHNTSPNVQSINNSSDDITIRFSAQQDFAENNNQKSPLIRHMLIYVSEVY